MAINLTRTIQVGSDYASTPFVKTYVKPALIEELSYLVTPIRSTS